MTYKLIIAGGRKITSYPALREALIDSRLWHLHKSDLVVVSGMAPGVDSLGLIFAQKAGLQPPLEFPAQWDDIKAPGAVVKTRSDGYMYNVIAGHQRNQQMADEADGLLLLWDGESSGSKDMLRRARKKGLDIYEYHLVNGKAVRQPDRG